MTAITSTSILPYNLCTSLADATTYGDASEQTLSLSEEDFSACNLKESRSLAPYLNQVYTEAHTDKISRIFAANLELLTAPTESPDGSKADELYIASSEALYLILNKIATKLPPTHPAYLGLCCALISTVFRKVIKTLRGAKDPEETLEAKTLECFSVRWMSSLICKVDDGSKESACFVWGHSGHFSFLQMRKHEKEKIQIELFDPHISRASSAGSSFHSHMLTVISTKEALVFTQAIVNSWTRDETYYHSLLSGYRFTSKVSTDIPSPLKRLNCTLAAPLAWLFVCRSEEKIAPVTSV